MSARKHRAPEMNRSADFRCPICNDGGTRVIDSRMWRTKDGVRRRRECPNGHRFTTSETIDLEYVATFEI